MSMACKAPMDRYERKHLVTQTAIDRLRELVPHVAHRDDEDLGNAIDRAVVDSLELPGHLEQWYDERQKDGRHMLWSLRLEGHLFFAEDERQSLYAILRAPAEGGVSRVVMTILPVDIYLRNVQSGRWQQPATKRRRREPGTSPAPTLGYKPFEGLAGMVLSPKAGRAAQEGKVSIEGREPPGEDASLEESAPTGSSGTGEHRDYLVLVDDPDEEMDGAWFKVPRGEVADEVRRLVDEVKVPPDAITVWRRVEMKARVRVEVDFGEE